MQPKSLLPLLLLLALLYPHPEARATQLDGHGLTQAQLDVAEQFQLGTPAGVGCSGGANALPVTAGKRYFLLAGTNQGGSFTTTGSTSGTLWTNTGGTLSAIKPGTNAINVRQQTSGSAVASTIFFTAPATETILLGCTSNGMQHQYDPPLSCTAAVACVGIFTQTSQNVGVLLDAEVTLAAETAILNSETTRLPTSTKFSWVRLNEPQTLVTTFGASGTPTSAGHDIAQRFQGNDARGTYLEITSVYFFVTSGCSGTIHVSVANSLTSPWNVPAEESNITFAFTSSVTGDATITLDWLNGLVSDDLDGLSFGTPTYSVKGSPITSTATLPPLVGTGTHYLRALAASPCTAVFRKLDGDPYPAGSLYQTNGGPTWNEQLGADAARFLLRTYGGDVRTFYHNLTPASVGGARYAWIREDVRDAEPGRLVLTTSYGGRAKSFGTLEATPSSIVNEYRLGYLNVSFRQTEAHTLSVAMNATGRNLLWGGTLLNQPEPQLHLSKTTLPQGGTATTLPVYALFSTDDYFTQASFTVYDCVHPCPEQAQRVAANYVATICTNGRTLAGTADTHGRFQLIGQDLGGCDVTLILTARGYDATEYLVTIPESGVYQFDLAIQQSISAQGTAVLVSVRITIEGNTTVTMPGRVQLNITRARDVPLFVGASHVDPATGKWMHNIVRPHYWASDEPRTFRFFYPERTNSTSEHRGAYVLWVMNETGRILATTKFFLLPPGQAFAQYDFLLTSGDVRLMEEASYPQARQSFMSKFQASLLEGQRSVRDEVYNDFKTISDYGGFVLGFLLFLATIRAIRR